MSEKLTRWNLMWLLAGVVLAITVAMAEPVGGGAICNDAVAQLLPCNDFLKKKSTAPSVECCNAARTVDKVAKLSKDYRRMLCQCLKDFAASSPINVVRSRQLPKICHVSPNINFDPHAMCQRKLQFN